jgi:hypothetical protein
LSTDLKDHCRYCGEVFCKECVKFKLPLLTAPKQVIYQYIKYHFESTGFDKLFTSESDVTSELNKLRKNIRKEKEDKKKKTFLDLILTNLTTVSTDNDGIKSPRNKKKLNNNNNKEEKLDEEQVVIEKYENMLSNVLINTCKKCWLSYYRKVCGDCGFEYCGKCRKEFHSDDICDDMINKKERKQKLKQQEKESENYRFFTHKKIKNVIFKYEENL